MGGKVFDHLKLQVPRMSPELYQRMIATYKPKLETVFQRVVIPRDAPDKADHGDIDFLVGGILVEARGEVLWKLIEAIFAADHCEPRGHSQSYAIPHPDIQGAYIQIDIELSPGDGTPAATDLFAWTNFMKSDADLVQIIGIAHRPLGLICNDQGLHVRLSQIESYNKQQALLFLTRDPAQALHFYGLDTTQYARGFTSETDLFTWVAGGRFFSHLVFAQRVEKAADKSRQLKRPMYRHFIESFMPGLSSSGGRAWTREEVLEEAVAWFEMQAEYADKIAAHDRLQAEIELWREVKTVLPPDEKACKAAVRALRRWVEFRDRRPVLRECPVLHTEYLRWGDYVGEDNREEVLAWVALSWREVKKLDKEYG